MFAVLALAFAASARAQCAKEWITASPVPGVDGIVNALTLWDPDGEGPLAPRVVAGGALVEAGGTYSGRVAAFDGEAWSHLPGLSTAAGSASISKLAVANGTLYAGATQSFAAPLSSAIIRWDGTAWVAVPGVPAGTLQSMGVADSELIIAIGTQVAAYNGTTWRLLGSPFNSSINGFTVWKGRLVAVGSFSLPATPPFARLAEWDGSAWLPIPGFVAGPGSLVTSVCVHEGDLVVGGTFTSVGGVSAERIARYDGTTWHALSIGLSGSPTVLASAGGFLYAGGTFATAGGLPAQGLARWNGTAWASLGVSLERVSAMVAVGDDVVAGGNFPTDLLSARVFRNLVRVGPAPTDALGGSDAFAGYIRRFATFNGDLFASFWHRDTPGASTHSMILAKRVNNRWERFEPTLRAATITVLDTGGPDLVIGGTFTAPPAIAGRGIARWTGTEWEPFAGGVSGSVLAATVFNGSLIVGGTFTAAGGVPARNIAAWNGTEWTPLGSGTSSTVVSLLALRGTLLVGGSFGTAGGMAVQGSARWSGLHWLTEPAQPPMCINKRFAPFSDTLAMMLFTHCGEPGASFVLTNGTTFQWLPQHDQTAPPRPPGFPATIRYAFVPFSDASGSVAHDGALYAGGLNYLSDTSQPIIPIPYRIIQHYDPASNRWSQIPADFLGTAMPLAPTIASAVDSEFLRTAAVTALHSDGDIIHVGGQFVSINGAPAYGYAQYRVPRRPFITTNVASTGTLPGGSLALNIVADGAAPLTFQWFKDGAPLVDGASPSGSVIAGASTPALTLDGIQAADQGEYHCVVSNACGSTSSSIASVSTCPTDYNRNGVPNPDDLGDMVTDFFTLPPIPGPGGFAIPCPENDPPFDSGYKAAYTPDLIGQCDEPFADNLGDFITDYFASSGC
ncbi:MAG: immunoglobulin domain-containing protein [Phycisphaerales bacterium]